MKIIFLLFLTFAMMAAFEGEVIGVSDGDTIKVRVLDDLNIKVRLWGIDSPEKKQKFGKSATIYLNYLIGHKKVRIANKGSDGFGRILGVVYLGGSDINKEMVKSGFAWCYEKFSSDYCEEESRAKGSRIGLWQENSPTPPWEFRKIKRISSRTHLTDL